MSLEIFQRIVKYFPMVFWSLIGYKVLNCALDFPGYRILDIALCICFILWVLYATGIEEIKEEEKMTERILKKLKDSQ